MYKNPAALTGGNTRVVRSGPRGFLAFYPLCLSFKAEHPYIQCAPSALVNVLLNK